MVKRLPIYDLSFRILLSVSVVFPQVGWGMRNPEDLSDTDHTAASHHSQYTQKHPEKDSDYEADDESGKPISRLLKKNTLLPRCEYYSRYQDTTHFSMTNPEHWGTYHRSTGRGGESGRYTQSSVERKTYKNLLINVPYGNVYHSKTGTFHNPYKFKEYSSWISGKKKRKAFDADAKKDILLYDEILKYKQKMCAAVVEAFGKNNGIVYYDNEYPCVMVKLPLFEVMERNANGEILNIENWNQLFIAYYVAIVNDVAHREGLPIELVIRSSFGHNGGV